MELSLPMAFLIEIKEGTFPNNGGELKSEPNGIFNHSAVEI